MIKKYSLVLIALLCSFFYGFGQIVAWEMDGNVGNETTVNATTLNPNLNISTINRGSGINPVILNNAFSSNNFTLNGTQANALTNNDYLQFQISPLSGYQVSLNTLDVTIRRSNTGPNTYIWRYSTDEVNFNNIGAPISYTVNAGNGTVQTQINLSTIPELQNVPFGTNITFRLYTWGATNVNGTFAIGRLSGNDLSIGGTVTALTTCSTTTTWTAGTWSSPPTANKVAIIDFPYNTSVNGSFEACSLIINAGNTLTVNNGNYVLVQNDVFVNGSDIDDPNIVELIVDTQGSFVQLNDTGTFTLGQYAKSQVNKMTAPLATLYNYTYWSSPVKDALIGTALTDANPNRLYYFDASAFQDPDGDGIDDIGDDWKLANLANTMEVGRGYASTHTSIGFMPGNSYQYNFAGEFNTGPKTEPLSYNPVNTTNHWNLVGNPYPSAIRVRGANSLFSENIGVIMPVVYMWSQYRPPLGSNPGNQNLNFSQDDYITINSGGPVGNGSDLDGDGFIDVPDDYIPSGQSFFVSSLAATDLTFNNAMRISGDNANDQFFGPNNSTQEQNNIVFSDERLWLNLISDNGAANQLLIGYFNEATDGFDLGYDTKRNLTSNSPAIIYTGINDISNEKLVIQGKSVNSLNINEMIPIGFDTSIDEPAIFTFSLIKFEGSFLENNSVYLKDNLLNKTHNLKASDYSFTSEVGEFNDRFEIVFNEAALSVNEVNIDKNTLQIVELQNGDVQFKVSSQFEMKSIEIIDLMGRTLYKLNAEGHSQTFSLRNLSQATYLAKVELTNGYVITKKALKRK